MFGPILKLSRYITLHLYNDSVPGLDAELGIDFSFLLVFPTDSFPKPGIEGV